MISTNREEHRRSYCGLVLVLHIVLKAQRFSMSNLQEQ